MLRHTNEINAGSMADIAFLLLIFFLVTTTMDMDKGISRILPPPPFGPPPVIAKQNILKVLINKNNKLMVEGKEVEIGVLKSLVKEFVLNPKNDKNLSDKKTKYIQGLGKIEVSKGIISLKNDRGTSYQTYISIQNKLAAAYSEIRDEFSKEHFNIGYTGLVDKTKIKAVQKAIPIAISEAEPENIGGK